MYSCATAEADGSPGRWRGYVAHAHWRHGGRLGLFHYTGNIAFAGGGHYAEPRFSTGCKSGRMAAKIRRGGEATSQPGRLPLVVAENGLSGSLRLLERTGRTYHLFLVGSGPATARQTLWLLAEYGHTGTVQLAAERVQQVVGEAGECRSRQVGAAGGGAPSCGRRRASVPSGFSRPPASRCFQSGR